MNLLSPSKTIENYYMASMENETNQMKNKQENLEEIEYRKNINFILFNSAIKNFLKLENSTEEISFDFNLHLNNSNANLIKLDDVNDPDKIFFSDLYYFEKEFESIYSIVYSNIFESYIKIFNNVFNCSNCQKLFKINGSCNCINDELNNSIITFTENLICILNFMNYKEKIFNEKIKELYSKKLEIYFPNTIPNNFNFNVNTTFNDVNEKERKNLSFFNNFGSSAQKLNNSCSNILMTNSNNMELKSMKQINFFNEQDNNKILLNKKFGNRIFNFLLIKFNTEISLILKIYIKCLLINFNSNIPNLGIQFIKPEIKELIVKCKLEKIVETFIEINVKDEIKYQVDLVCEFYDKAYLDNIFLFFQNHYAIWIKGSLCCKSNELMVKTKKIEDEIIDFLHREYINSRINNFVEIIKLYPESTPILLDVRKSIGSIQQSKLVEKIKIQLEKRLLTQGIATSLIIEMFIRLINIMKIIDNSSILLELVSNPIKLYLRTRKDTMRCIINFILNEDDSSIKAEMENQGTSRKKANYINIVSNNIIENISSDEDECEAEKWEPLPLEITRNQKSIKKNKFSDIISTLVFIFGSPEEFVEHYKRMLAERSVSDKLNKFSIENEIKNLELLKVKFGENYFQSCEVLIKDVKESIKLNKSIQMSSELNSSDLLLNFNTKKPAQNSIHFGEKKKLESNRTDVTVMIISKNYWPFKNNEIYDLKESKEEDNILNFNKFNSLSKEFVNLSEIDNIKENICKKNSKNFLKKINENLEKYKKAYSIIKSSRTLEYFTNLGFVDLELIFENGTFKFRVSPLSALIINLFDEDLIMVQKQELNESLCSQTKNKENFNQEIIVEDYKMLTVEFISEILKSSVSEVRKRLNFWVSKGVLREISYDMENDENTFYYPNEILQNYPVLSSRDEIKQDEILIYEEEIFNFEFISNDQNKLNLENAVSILLKNSGPKSFEQLLKKLALSYKVNICEIKLKEILGKMTLEQKIFKDGEFFNILIQTN